jgi:hypothetical protein
VAFRFLTAFLAWLAAFSSAQRMVCLGQYRVGSMLLNADQEEHEKGKAGDDFLLETVKEYSSPYVFSGLTDHAFIASQNVHLSFLQQTFSKKLPEKPRPGDQRCLQPLDGPIAATSTCPVIANLATIIRLN